MQNIHAVPVPWMNRCVLRLAVDAIERTAGGVTRAYFSVKVMVCIAINQPVGPDTV